MNRQQLLEYYNFYSLSKLNNNDLNKLYKIVFKVREYLDSKRSYKYLYHSLKHPDIYQTVFNT